MARQKQGGEARPRGSRAVALRPAGGQAVANLQDLTAQARANHEAVVSLRTRQEYAKCWRRVEEWCADNGAQALPIHIGTVILYATWLMEVRGYSKTSIMQAVSAIKHRHRMEGALPIDRDNKPTAWKESGLGSWLKSINRKIDESGRTARQAKALTDQDLRDVFELMRPTQPREIRDAAIMVLAYAGCRRRSEVVGLDYVERSTGDDGATGVLQVTAEGVAITLHRSKTHQDGGKKPEHYFVRRRDVPRGCTAVETWLKVGRITPGTPVFRRVRGTGYELNRATGEPGITDTGAKTNPFKVKIGRSRHVGYFPTKEAAIRARDAAAGGAYSPVQQDRLAGASVSSIIKTRMFQVLRARRLTETKRKRLRPDEIAELKALAAQYSGHSGRVGAITSAARRGRRRDEIMRMSGHKTPTMVDRYIEAEEVKDNNFMMGSGL